MKTRYISRLFAVASIADKGRLRAVNEHGDSANRHARRESRVPNWGLMRRTALAAIAPLTLGVGIAHAPVVRANDVTVPPAMCVAPFLNQAFPMRWHENYLMNPPSGTPTWVICPLTYDNDVVDFRPNLLVYVTGGISGGLGGSDFPTCYFTIAARTNLSQPPYINGQPKKYLMQLSTRLNSPQAQLWEAETDARIPIADIERATGTTDNNRWTASVFCRLPPGYGITQVFTAT